MDNIEVQEQIDDYQQALDYLKQDDPENNKHWRAISLLADEIYILKFNK